MPDNGVIRIAVVCEADADRRVSCMLADRILCEKSDWVDAETIESVREWCSVNGEFNFLAWKSIRDHAKKKGIRAHGHFQGEPGASDAFATRLALLIVNTIEPRPHAVLLIRDTDGDEERIRGLIQAREDRPWEYSVIIGVAHPKRECWLLAAFDATSDYEKRSLAELVIELEFNPCQESHRLNAKDSGALRDAKRVLMHICDDAFATEQWLTTASLDRLRERGKENGLAPYLQELENRLVPVFG